MRGGAARRIEPRTYLLRGGRNTATRAWAGVSARVGVAVSVILAGACRGPLGCARGARGSSWSVSSHPSTTGGSDRSARGGVCGAHGARGVPRDRVSCGRLLCHDSQRGMV